MSNKEKKSINIGTILWLFFAVFQVRTVIATIQALFLNVFKLPFLLGIKLLFSRFSLNTIIPIFLFAATILLAMALTKKNTKLISISTLSLFLLNLMVCIKNLPIQINQMIHVEQPVLYFVYALSIIGAICYSMYYLFLFIDRNKIFDFKQGELRKSFFIALIGAVCSLIGGFDFLNHDGTTATMILGMMLPAIPYILMVLFTLPGNRRTVAESDTSVGKVVAVFVACFAVYFGIYAYINHSVENRVTTYYIDYNFNGKCDWGESVYSEDKDGNITWIN